MYKSECFSMISPFSILIYYKQHLDMKTKGITSFFARAADADVAVEPVPVVSIISATLFNACMYIYILYFRESMLILYLSLFEFGIKILGCKFYILGKSCIKIQYTLFYKNNFIRTHALKSEWRKMGRTMAFCLEQKKI